jgi:hypothetical protein
MIPEFLSHQTPAVAPKSHLLDLLSELIDAHADTVQLVNADQRTGLEWSAHCDYLRALQRLGHETLAHHDQRSTPPPPARAVPSGLHPALSHGWTAALAGVRAVARAVHALSAVSP